MDYSLKVYAICCVILFLKMNVIGYVQAFVRISNHAYTNPEDASFNKKEPVTAELPMVEKAAKAYRNDFENIPIFLFLALDYVMLDCWEGSALLYFSSFTNNV